MSDIKTLLKKGDTLFGERTTLMTHWQDIAEQFYPQRADFTIWRILGEEFADHLYSSYPLLVQRELSTSFAAMLRPRDKEWYEISVEDEETVTKAGKEWLEFARKRMRRAMYTRDALFIRATTQGDADFSAFGQCCISREIDWNAKRPHLLYRNWHLRDVAWSELSSGKIGEIHIRWKPTIEDLKRLFPKEGQLHHSVSSKSGIEALAKVNCRIVVIMTENYHGETGFQQPWVITHIDADNFHQMEETGKWTHGYTIPRWQTVSGSQYAYSPAAVAGLPDARLIQAMTLTLLEAGEMAVRPPVVATIDAIREDVNWFPGGITWADADYDERKGEVLRPISQDKSGIPFGMEATEIQREMLATAFYLNKLTLPPAETEMTAYETSKRIEEYIRSALPLFEPMEMDYNGSICEDTFDELLRVGTFGSVNEIPAELRGRDVEFKFISPLHDAIKRQKASTFIESKELIMQAMEIDPGAFAMMDTQTALREALDGINVSEDWMRSERDTKAILAQRAKMEQAAEQLQLAETAGSAAEKFSNAQGAA